MALNPCGNFVKILLVIVNVIYVLVGFLLVGLGVVFLVEGDEFKVLTGDDNLFVGIGLMTAGVFTVLIAFLGIISSIGETYPLLIVYVCLSVGMICLEVGIVAVCYVERMKITAHADDKFKEYIGKYRSVSSDDYNSKVNEVIDVAQSDLNCCGLSSYRDWVQYNSDYVFINGLPGSCECDKESDGSDNCIGLIPSSTDYVIKGVWKRGCNDTFYSLVGSNLTAIGGSGIGIVVVQILTVMLAVALCICVVVAKAKERRVARIQALAYTQLDSLTDDDDSSDSSNSDPQSHEGDSRYAAAATTHIVGIGPNDDVPTDDHTMYIK